MENLGATIFSKNYLQKEEQTANSGNPISPDCTACRISFDDANMKTEKNQKKTATTQERNNTEQKRHCRKIKILHSVGAAELLQDARAENACGVERVFTLERSYLCSGRWALHACLVLFVTKDSTRVPILHVSVDVNVLRGCGFCMALLVRTHTGSAVFFCCLVAARHGTAVATYFTFLMWMFQLNFVIFVLMVLFVVAPQLFFDKKVRIQRLLCSGLEVFLAD